MHAYSALPPDHLPHHPVHSIRPVSEAEAAHAYRELKAAMEATGLPTNGLYREVLRGSGTDTHLYGIGTFTLAGALRLTAVLNSAGSGR
ncbi:hypothetical protein ACF1BN_28560 [Streptomyces sp. NPDC014861]|uniref:hypothetical protein n=1 Tax=Streptomyces sp. NPDC014861 TaxID=3364923 RepID=UPI0036FB1850